jgi:DinB superfamily
MKRAWMIVLAGILVSSVAPGLQAQESNPIAANLKASWENIRDLLGKMAEKMPAEDYRFKPTPEIQDFGQRMAHVVGFNMRNCAMLKGEQKNINAGQEPTKADIEAAIKETNAECDSLFASLNDAELMQKINAGRGGERMKLAIIEGNILEHSQEVYGYMAVYLRLKGIVPPSSERNEMPGMPGMGGGRGGRGMQQGR